MTRRDAIGLGLGAAAALLSFPEMLSAATGRGVTELDVALQAARWIRSSRVETSDGVSWPADPLKPDGRGTDLYNGFPGVVLFHLELYHATADTTWLDEAKGGANELIARLPAIQQTGNCGLYTGLAGAAWILEETHRASGDGRFRDAASRAVEMIHSLALKADSGASWPRGSATTDIISGNSGIGLFLLWADREMKHSTSRPLAVEAGRKLLTDAQLVAAGRKWPVATSVRNLYPNFSHGTAGTSYFLSTLYQATGRKEFLDAAVAGAQYLDAVANRDGGGFKVFHHEPGGEDLYYLSWCHGPAGTSRLHYRLASATQADGWLDRIRQGAKATIDSGVPERRTPGFWNNISQCCGNCGVGEYFLTLDRIMPGQQYAAMVKRVAADTVARATTEGRGMKWTQAENRVSPDAVIAQTGFMQGAAGVGTFFLHMDAARAGKRSPIVWPDTPY
jgi:lantibiotic modifying enzyme